MVNRWLQNVQRTFAGSRCALCASRDCRGSQLCCECTAEMPWLEAACPRCSDAMDEAADEYMPCGRCQCDPPPFRLARCLFAYRYPVDKLVTAFKFNGQLQYGRLLGELLGNAMVTWYAQRSDLPGCIVPVPLHRSRLRERGFNQAYELARCCSRKLAIPLAPDLCKRHRATRHQPGLTPAARRRNLRNAFSLTPTSSSTAPASILLLDDVMTTGTTLRELAIQFRRAGTQDIQVWCVARALTE